MEQRRFRIEPLTPSRRDDYLRFFDHERGIAFADNPQWAKCYCHYYHVPRAIEWESLDANANRIAISSRIEVGEMEGFIAYVGDELSREDARVLTQEHAPASDGRAPYRVVGWVNAQPLHKLPHCWGRLGIERPAAELPPSAMAAIVCFVIAPAWRRQGVARALLQGLIESFTARGIRRVYAFPFRHEQQTNAPTAHYHGPESLFREHGFVDIDATPQLCVMARDL